MTSSIILKEDTIKHKIRRMAFQIYEANIENESVILAGIVDSGYTFAEILMKELQSISHLKVLLCKVFIDKKNPINSIRADISLEEINEKSIVLVDDVLNSGSTLIYASTYFLQVPLKQFKTAVFVDRNHKKFPIKADYKGISLSTSLNENVTVNFAPKMTVSLK